MIKHTYWGEEIILEPEEEICPSCKGHGVGQYPGETSFDRLKLNEPTGETVCLICDGTGKVDWVTNCMH